MKCVEFCTISPRNSNLAFLPSLPAWIYLLRPPSKFTFCYWNHLEHIQSCNCLVISLFPVGYLLSCGKGPTLSYVFHFSKALPGPGYKTAAQNIFVKLTELNLSQESSTQEEVLTNKEAEQQLLEVTMLTSIWRLFGSFFHFLTNGIRGSAADNGLWHGDLNPGSLQKAWPSRSEDIDQHREGGGSEIESHQAIQNCKKKKKCCSFYTLEKAYVQSSRRRGTSVGSSLEKCRPLFCSHPRYSIEIYLEA